MFDVVFLIIAGFLLIDFIFMNLESSKTRIGLRLPLVGDLLRILKHFDDFSDYATRLFVARRSTHPINLILGRINMWGLVDPADVEHILKTNWKNYPVGKGVRGESLKDLFGNGIFAADGDSWFVQRKTVSREFTMNNFKTFMLREFAHYAQILKEKLSTAAKEGSDVDMHAEFFRLTLDSFGKVAFGVDLGGLKGTPVPFAAAFDDAQEICARRLATKPPFLWKLQKAIGVGAEVRLKEDLHIINNFVKELCDARSKKREEEGASYDPTDNANQDLFSRLYMISEGEESLTKEKQIEYLRDMTVNFMIAGRDTTACALSWTVWELFQNPDKEKKMVEEVRECIPNSAKNLTYEDLSECHYMTAVVHEALRLHPSVHFDPKYVVADDVLPSGVRVKAGDSVAYIPYTMARMKEIWGEDASEFKPERWLKGDGSFQKADNFFKYPVFQAGPRLCLGMDMALLELKAVLATLYSNFNFKVEREPKIRTTVVLQMTAEGIPVKVFPRSD